MPVPGEFDNDESVAILEKVVTSKKPAPRARMITSQPIPRATSTSKFPPPGPLAAAPPAVRRTQQVRLYPLSFIQKLTVYTADGCEVRRDTIPIYSHGEQ